LHQPSEFEREKHCHYWRWGILEILSAEGVLAAAESGGRKNHKLTLQVWRSWPLLTPYQVKTFLSGAKQAAHQAWLEKWSGVTGVPFDIWATETAENVIEQFPDRQAGRECPGGFVRNPWRKGWM
jgi:hypothetical protein